MSIETPTATSLSPIRTPVVSRSPSFAGKPRKPSPLRRSSTPEDPEHRLAVAFQRGGEGSGAKELAGQEEMDVQHQGRRASDGQAITSITSTQTSSAFINTSTSKSTSDLADMSCDAPRARKIGNSAYTLPPIRPHPKFPHSSSIRPLRPLSSVTGSSGGGANPVGSLTSVPHAGQGTSKAPQRQKIIVPAKSWKACFDLNLTQKELARFD